MNNLNVLHTSAVTQHTTGHVKSEWKLYANGEDKVLMTFPSTYSEAEVFAIMDFAKKYELEAFNNGIAFGKKATLGVYEPKLEQAYKDIEFMKLENIRLATALEKIYMENNPEV